MRYPDAGVAIVVEASGAFREVVVYAPPSEETVCLEPYTAPTNAMNLADRGVPVGTISLEAGDQWHGTVRISAIG